MERLFSYGTLRYSAVQRELFGRELEGEEGVLLGYRVEEVRIKDEGVVKASGEDVHPILKKFDGGRVEGVVFLLSADELKKADGYEVDDYVRQWVEIEGMEWAWAYVARD